MIGHGIMPHTKHREDAADREPVVEEFDVELGGRRVHYRKGGAGPPVLLLHGGASDSRDWLSAIEALSDRYTLYAPDMVGFGLSHRSNDSYRLQDFVGFALDFMQAMGMECPAVVGHSLGGRVCIEIASSEPARVGRLVLVDTAGFGDLTLWGNLMGTVFWTLRRVLRLPKPYPQFAKGSGGYDDWACHDLLSRLQVPTLVVWSRFDPYYSLRDARKAVALMPQARLAVLSCCGHAPHIRRRRQFNSIVGDFLDEALSHEGLGCTGV